MISSDPAEHPILLMDGECVLCNRVSQFLIRRDPQGEFLFSALQSKTASRLLTERGLPTPPAGTFVMILGREAYYRSDAALGVLSRMPFPWNLARVAFLIPRPIRDFGYDLVARTRIRFFGRTSLCGLLTPEERSRFLMDDAQ